MYYLQNIRQVIDNKDNLGLNNKIMKKNVFTLEHNEIKCRITRKSSLMIKNRIMNSQRILGC